MTFADADRPMEIDARSDDPERPYANLQPIIDALVRAGNEVIDGGFQLTPGGWECLLARPIDFEIVSTRFVLPANVEASPDIDSILDRDTWCVGDGRDQDFCRYFERLPPSSCE